MASEAFENLDTWEKMMACCFPCGYVWMKEGTGGACCLNCCLGMWLGMCFVNVCHACSFVGDQGKPGSPYDGIQQKVVMKQPL